MIVLDTNVVLEPYRELADPKVMEWLDRQNPQDLWLTAITAAELRAGVEKYPPGEQRQSRHVEVSGILEENFSGRILSFDLRAAMAYAQIAGPLSRAERAIRWMDLLIASITRSNRAALATRNVRDFVAFGIEIIDPWGSDAP